MLESEALEPHERSERELDVIELRACRADLSLFDLAKLLDAAMEVPDAPRPQGKTLAVGTGQPDAAGGPVFRVAVRGDNPEEPDHAVSFQVHHSGWPWPMRIIRSPSMT